MTVVISPDIPAVRFPIFSMEILDNILARTS